jgi:hypothetical protein
LSDIGRKLSWGNCSPFHKIKKSHYPGYIFLQVDFNVYAAEKARTTFWEAGGWDGFFLKDVRARVSGCGCAAKLQVLGFGSLETVK